MLAAVLFQCETGEALAHAAVADFGVSLGASSARTAAPPPCRSCQIQHVEVEAAASMLAAWTSMDAETQAARGVMCYNLPADSSSKVAPPIVYPGNASSTVCVYRLTANESDSGHNKGPMLACFFADCVDTSASLDVACSLVLSLMRVQQMSPTAELVLSFGDATKRKHVRHAVRRAVETSLALVLRYMPCKRSRPVLPADAKPATCEGLSAHAHWGGECCTVRIAIIPSDVARAALPQQIVKASFPETPRGHYIPRPPSVLPPTRTSRPAALNRGRKNVVHAEAAVVMPLHAANEPVQSKATVGMATHLTQKLLVEADTISVRPAAVLSEKKSKQSSGSGSRGWLPQIFRGRQRHRSDESQRAEVGLTSVAVAHIVPPTSRGGFGLRSFFTSLPPFSRSASKRRIAAETPAGKDAVLVPRPASPARSRRVSESAVSADASTAVRATVADTIATPLKPRAALRMTVLGAAGGSKGTGDGAPTSNGLDALTTVTASNFRPAPPAAEMPSSRGGLLSRLRIRGRATVPAASSSSSSSTVPALCGLPVDAAVPPTSADIGDALHSGTAAVWADCEACVVTISGPVGSRNRATDSVCWLARGSMSRRTADADAAIPSTVPTETNTEAAAWLLCAIDSLSLGAPGVWAVEAGSSVAIIGMPACQCHCGFRPAVPEEPTRVCPIFVARNGGQCGCIADFAAVIEQLRGM